MKKLLLLFTVLCATVSLAQTKYLTKTGEVTFEASVPSFEEVKATNKNTTAILNADNGEFASLVLVKGFRFKNALMEEHFNENYADSDDFPKAKLKGTIKNFSIRNSKTTFTATLNFHGRKVTFKDQPITITTSNNDILLSGEFMVNVNDFGIEIPSVVSKKLSKDVKVNFKFSLKKK